jgi:hypothetical protein
MSSLEKNLRPLPRTWDEAKRNATYACSIQRQKSELEDLLEFCSGFLLLSPVIALAMYVFYLILIAKGF